MNKRVDMDADELGNHIGAGPLEQIDPANVERFESDTIWPVFERLRREDPVHFTPESEFGPYWSITRWNDIMAVGADHEAFSSAGSIRLLPLQQTTQGNLQILRPGGAGFISMDPPDHGHRRQTVAPALTPANVALMAHKVRGRAGRILDELPIGEEFDWVDKVSKELTAMTLATLFDFPYEDRRKLVYWSDMFTSVPGRGPVISWEQKYDAAREANSAFAELWNQRAKAPPAGDLISMLAHGDATRDMSRQEFQGTVALLIVAGSDTTRNLISGSIHALSENPEQHDKLRENPELIRSMVGESLRWQSPIAHMSRTATRDIEVGGKVIPRGAQVAMWYASGNRDETVIDNPNSFIIDRERPHQHLSFGYGIHRCIGNRMAEMQLQIIWEEILKRFPEVCVVGQAKRTSSSFTRGYDSLLVTIPSRV